MRASLDTNAIIHFYRANLQSIIFDFFIDGVFIYEQIREVELVNHAKELLDIIDADIRAGKIEVYIDIRLKEQNVYNIFKNNVHDNQLLYSTGDMGEVYAISLAQTIGAFSLVTDDIKPGGPYISLLQFEDDILPFTFADILILRYLLGHTDETQTVTDFISINMASNLNWSFKSHIAKFIKRFFKDPYKEFERIWIQKLVSENNIKVKSKLDVLNNVIKTDYI